MPQFGTSRPYQHVASTVAIGGRADIGQSARNDVIDPERHFDALNNRTAKRLFDHLVGGHEQVMRHREAERLCSFEIDGEAEFGRLQYRQITGLFVPDDPIRVVLLLRTNTEKVVDLPQCRPPTKMSFFPLGILKQLQSERRQT